MTEDNNKPLPLKWVRWDAAENTDGSKVKVMIKEIRCNQETKQEGEKAKETLEDLSSR